MTDIEQYRPKHRAELGYDLYYRNKGLGSQATAVVTRTVSSTVADPEQFLPALSSDMHVDLLVHGPRGDYREFNVAPGVEKGTWQWSQIPVDLLKPEPKSDFIVGRCYRHKSGSVFRYAASDNLLCVESGTPGDRVGSTQFHRLTSWSNIRESFTEVPEPAQTRYKDGFWATEAGDIVWKIEGNKATCVRANVASTPGYRVGHVADASKFGSFLVPYDPPVNTVYKPREVPTPAPFKVGDRVELVENYMGHPAGTTSTITHVGPSNRRGAGYVMIATDVVPGAYAHRFKHAAPAPKPAPFKHGDIIRRIKDRPQGALYRVVNGGVRRLSTGGRFTYDPNHFPETFELVASDPAL